MISSTFPFKFSKNIKVDSKYVKLATLVLLQDQLSLKEDHGKGENGVHSSISNQLEESSVPQPVSEESKVALADSDVGTEQTRLKREEDLSDTGNLQDKALKKPDKILPCPRCKSMDTKFCYFNNYNVNQPRHFCKNCQRYWTAGGTMRNVPVGAGRRRNKTSIPSQICQQTSPEALQSSPRVDFPNEIHPNVLASDMPVCDSMVSVLNIAHKMIQHNTMNGLQSPREENGHGQDHDRTGESSVAAASWKDELGNNGIPDLIPNCPSFTPSVPHIPGAPWLYAWPTVQYPSSVSPPSFGPAGFPLPFYPTGLPSYWGCSVPTTWNVPWLIPLTLGPTHSNTPPSSKPGSPTLGKHSRDENAFNSGEHDKDTDFKESNPDNFLWVPKTLRIDDPSEAAKSSIWATLGIKNDRVEDTIRGSSLFKALQSQSNGDKKAQVQVPKTSAVLQANPAALSRSLSFHESS